MPEVMSVGSREFVFSAPQHSQSHHSVSKIASIFQCMEEDDVVRESTTSFIEHTSRPSSSNSRSRSADGRGLPIYDKQVVQDNKSNFSSTKAMFENLEKKQLDNGSVPVTTQVGLSYACSSSVDTRPVALPRRSVSPVRAVPANIIAPRQIYSARDPPSPARKVNAKPESMSARGPPPIPPKPMRLDKDHRTRVGGSLGDALDEDIADIAPTGSNRRSYAGPDSSDIEHNQNGVKEDSPLTEVTRQFSELVNDLEKMNGHSPNASPRPFRASTNSEYVTSRYPRLTQTLNMENKTTNPPPHNAPIAKPSSLYEPYWRQHSWLSRRYNAGANDSSAENGQRSAAQPYKSPTVVQNGESSSPTMYGLFRTRNNCESQPQTSNCDDNSESPKPQIIDDNHKKDYVQSETQNIVQLIPNMEAEPQVRMRNIPPKQIKEIITNPEPLQPPTSRPPVDFMTREEASVLLSPSSREDIVGESTGEVRPLSSLSSQGMISDPAHVDGAKRLSTCSIESAVEQMLIASAPQSPDKGGVKAEPPAVHWYEDGHYMMEIPGLMVDNDVTPTNSPTTTYKPPERVQFSIAPMKVYSTHSEFDYDRRNDDIDPVAASAEYELERRLDKMDVFDVELDKGNEGLGFSIIGMGVGADAGLEKLGIFVKSITPGGAVHRDGRIQVCDQIVEVDGCSLVGVTQAYAASVLRGTLGQVKFRIGRESALEGSEIAALIRQSLEQDRMRAQQQLLHQMQSGTSSEGRESCEDSSTTATPSLDGDKDMGGSEDATPEPLVQDQPHIDHLMMQLKKSHDSTHEEDSENEEEQHNEDQHQPDEQAFRCETGSGGVSQSHKSYTPPEPPYSEPMSQLLAESLQDTAFKMKSAYLDQSKAAINAPVRVSPSTNRRSPNASGSASETEREIGVRINWLESRLGDTRVAAEEFQKVLNESQQHCNELESKYTRAKQMLKEYQTREKDLLEREEAHLRQLREKDTQYSHLVGQLKGKIDDLEAQLTDAHRKRASMVESQHPSEDNTSTDCAPSQALSPLLNPRPSTSDISPALAYQPSKKIVTAAQNDQTRRRVNIDGSRRRDFECIPSTELLDSTAAKSKVDAVKQSEKMCARQLPSRRHETEVLVMCHHTMEHAHSLCSTASSHRTGLTSDGQSSSVGPSSRRVRLSSDAESASPSKSSSTSAGMSPLPGRRSVSHGRLLKRPFHKELEITREHDVHQALDVLHWSCEDVCNFLKNVGLEKYTPEFTINKMDGCKFLQLDGTRLKAMGVQNHTDRSLIKKRVKELKNRIEKERKQIEKESRLMAKAEKAKLTKRPRS